ncbi:MAG: FHA domain-containing protein, partial [Myxococcaceae bacterium]
MSANLALVRNPSPSMTLEVLVYHGSRQESRHALADGTYVVGSAPDATIRLVHPDVDSHHAVLLVSGGNVALKHLRPQAPAPRLLANIDTLQCGPFLLRTRIAVRSRSSERTPRSPAPELDRTKVAPRLQSVPNHVDPNQTRISRRETGSEAVVRTPTAERKSIGERRSTVERRAIPERRATVE